MIARLLATVSPQLSNSWLAQVSYTYSYLRGNYAGLFRPETGQLDPNINSDFDLRSLLENRYRVEHLIRNTQRADDILVEHAHTAGGNRAHGELVVAGDAELANDEDIERRAERTSHFSADWHADTSKESVRTPPSAVLTAATFIRIVLSDCSRAPIAAKD